MGSFYRHQSGEKTNHGNSEEFNVLVEEVKNVCAKEIILVSLCKTSHRFRIFHKTVARITKSTWTFKFTSLAFLSSSLFSLKIAVDDKETRSLVLSLEHSSSISAGRYSYIPTPPYTSYESTSSGVILHWF